MTVHVTFHENLTVETNQGKQVPALGPQIGNAATLEVGLVDSFGPAPRDCMVSIKVVTACRLAIGDNDAAHASNSEWLPAGFIDTRFVRDGDYVSVIEPA